MHSCLWETPIRSLAPHASLHTVTSNDRVCQSPPPPGKENKWKKHFYRSIKKTANLESHFPTKISSATYEMIVTGMLTRFWSSSTTNLSLQMQSLYVLIKLKTFYFAVKVKVLVSRQTSPALALRSYLVNDGMLLILNLTSAVLWHKSLVEKFICFRSISLGMLGVDLSTSMNVF